MEKDTLRMQFLSGIITEGQYKVKLQENENEEIAAKVEPILNKPEVEKKIKDIYSNLSDDEKKELESSLKKLGINASTSPKDAHDAVQNVADNVGGGMSEGDENIDPKKKVADILHGIGAANIAAFGGVPAAIVIGGLLAGTVGSPMIAGFAISWGVTGLLMELAKLLEKEPGSSNESLNESMIGGIVGIGAINQIPPRAKADYETAFEHFLGGKYGLNEVEIEEAEIPAIDSEIANDPDFQKLVDYFEENPIKAKKVKDKLKTLEEITENQYGVNKSSDGSYFTQDGVYSTYYFKKNDKYYKKQSLPGGYGFGKHKTDEISKEDFQKIQKEYWKDQLMKIGLGAAAVGFVGALMAGPLGANDPGNILQAALIAAGFGGAAASIFE